MGGGNETVDVTDDLCDLSIPNAAKVEICGLSKAEYCHDLRHYLDTPEDIRRQNGGLNPHCMGELSTLLSSLVITSHLLAKLHEIGLPALRRCLSAWWQAWWARTPPNSEANVFCSCGPVGVGLSLRGKLASKSESAEAPLTAGKPVPCW